MNEEGITMKKMALILMVLVLMTANAAFAEEVFDGQPAPTPDLFSGLWVCGRASIEMDWEEEGYRVLIQWGSSAWEYTEWEYSGFYHEEDQTVVTMPFGRRTDLVYNDESEIASAKEIYDDGEAVFSLDAEGYLIWLDEKENAGADMRFEHVEVVDTDQAEKPKVVILATGGTIAGVGEAGKTAGYAPGTLTAEELIAAVPELEQAAEIEAIQVCNVNSDDITAEIWLELVQTINRMAADPDVQGFVITHGTDTMEETAYFLNLTVKTEKPVVVTGSMRPSTSISADGPMNLYQAVCVAASPEAVGKGVLAVFSDRIYSARSVTKTSTYHVTAIAAGEMGAIGVVRDGSVYLYETPAKKHTVQSEFDVTGLTALPKVSILYFSVDADVELLRFAAEHSDGLVIAGAGAGEFSEGFKAVIEGLEIPVVISSRIDDGVITADNLLCANTVAADNLSPQKAAILLRLALTQENPDLVRMYSEY